MSRTENITKMPNQEVQSMSSIAAKLYDTFTDDTQRNLTPKQAFILGYLHGREKLMDEMGMFDDLDDDSTIYDFIERQDKTSRK